MEKIWLNSYPQGVPAEIDPDKFSSVAALFETMVKKFPNRPVVSNFDFTLTFDELNKQADTFAAFLQHKLQLKKGDRFAIMMPNVIQYLVAIFAAFKIGLVVVNVNPLYTKRELAHQLKDADAQAIIVMANFAGTVQSALPETSVKNVIITEVGDALPFIKKSLINFIVKRVQHKVPEYKIPEAITYCQAMKMGRQYTCQPVALSGHDLAFLQYTGGTTGVAKGAMLTHRNMIANVEQAYAWIAPFVDDGREAIVTPLPLYHIFSLLANCLVFIRAGSENVLITNPRDIKGTIKTLKNKRFTAITGVNTLFNGLVNYPDFAQLNFSHLKVVLGGGMAVQRSVAEQWKRITGVHITEAYGLTETSPAVTINPLTLHEFNSSIGLPIPSTEVKIINEDGTEMPIGGRGELCVRGPQVMLGYWNRPDETTKVLSADGWLKTGDIAYVDEAGFVYIVDRKKDMIDVSGFNVYPNELEDVIVRHPGVLEVAVIGVPSDSTGEAIKAFVVRKDPNLTETELKEFCRQSLTGYKVPKMIEFRNELPKSNVGKILRRALRDEELKKMACQS